MTLPSAVPPSAASLAAALARSACSLFSRTKAEPFLEKTAMSLVESRTGSMGASCLVKTVLPSKNGGVRAWTITCTALSLSSSKSRSSSLRDATPEVTIRLASHRSLSAFCRIIMTISKASDRVTSSTYVLCLSRADSLHSLPLHFRCPDEPQIFILSQRIMRLVARKGTLLSSGVPISIEPNLFLLPFASLDSST